MEIATVQHGVLMRDSKTAEGPVLSFSGQVWNDFLADVKSGGFRAN